MTTYDKPTLRAVRKTLVEFKNTVESTSTFAYTDPATCERERVTRSAVVMGMISTFDRVYPCASIKKHYYTLTYTRGEFYESCITLMRHANGSDAAKELTDPTVTVVSATAIPGTEVEE